MAGPQSSDLIVGKEYLTLVCDACKNVIPIARAGKVFASGSRKMLVGCPFCGASGEHDPEEWRVRQLELLPPTPH